MSASKHFRTTGRVAVTFYLTKAEHEELKKAALAEDRKRANFCRRVVNREVKKTLIRQESEP